MCAWANLHPQIAPMVLHSDVPKSAKRPDPPLEISGIRKDGYNNTLGYLQPQAHRVRPKRKYLKNVR